MPTNNTGERRQAGGGGAEQTFRPGEQQTQEMNARLEQALQNQIKQLEEQKQKPTHARQIQDMNEAQLEIEIARLERQVASAERAVEQAGNTASMRFFNDTVDRFQGGVGPSAVDSRYRRMQDRWMNNDMPKLIEAQKKLAQRREVLERMQDALQKIRGTGKTLRTVATATGSKGSGKWEATTFTVYDRPVKAQRMGDYVVAKPFYTYNLYDARTGKQIRTFKTKKAAVSYVEKL